ncbi:MAG: PfkB family carbohydrate kinase [Actinomycetota bacterium]|nr:PfkB family carbohydrate kinase [Actinomycetota bacterium]
MRIVVVGDCLLDVDLTGIATRLSPDAPVPVVDVSESIDRAGGAGLVATMLAGDGIDVTLLTALGDDDGAERLRNALNGILVIAAPLVGPTPVKTRVRADGHAIVRLDEGGGPTVATPTQAQLDAIDAADVVIASDYGRGLLADERLRAAIGRRARGAPVVWDPHPRGARPVPRVALATPNDAEASALSGQPPGGVAEAMDAASVLRMRWQADAVAVTLGGRGAIVSSGADLPVVVPTDRIDAADPCGAGDRLAASAGIVLGGGGDAHDAVIRGVADASAYLRAGGVASLLRPPEPTPLIGTAVDAIALARHTHAAGGTVVATGGCFDLLHAGHVRTLQAARALGDCLVVCLNSDDSVRRLKGASRPIIAAADRVDLLLALECVDAVLVFDEDTPVEALRRLAPDLWVKGGDYRAANLPEAAVVAENGGRVVTVPHHPARSTSALAAALAAVS